LKSTAEGQNEVQEPMPGPQRASTFPMKNPVSSFTSSYPASLTLADSSYSNSISENFSPSSNDLDSLSSDTHNDDSLVFSHFGLAPSNTGTMPNTTTHGLPDMSAMMFPSTDPFAYPNQPMMTLENNAFATPSPKLNSNTLASSNLPSPQSSVFQINRIGNNTGLDPSMEAQIFDPLQPFLNMEYRQGMGDMGTGISDMNIGDLSKPEEAFGDWWNQGSNVQGSWSI
jgi:hypothetical protein